MHEKRPFASAIALLPSMFRPTCRPSVRMRVHVATTGPEPGNWLIAIDERGCRVFPGFIATPDARLYTDSEIGHSILTGGTTIGEALRSRLLDYEGDLDKLRHFRACFQFGGVP